MSTRCTTHFVYGSEVVAIVYRHSDGYPEGAGVDIRRFLEECSKLKDSRFTDPEYLAAKYVVFLASMFNYDKTSRLDFISVGVTRRDPDDIRYRYVIDCANLVNGLPTVTCYQILGLNKNKQEIDIPTIPVTKD